ncbi:FeoA family protein [Rhodohalobacter sp.]|uniref:FeoA family protein n=1 Tax=Rhodohalobacter sp. TaxID=1974210 RepID=UPI003A101A82
MKLKPINSAKKGERVSIQCLRCGHEDNCQLQALGCIEGAMGEILSNHSRVILKIGETRLAISENMAKSILINPQ